MPNPLLTIESAARSDCGKVRSNNEDAYMQRDDAGLWAVADGMGGHGFGDVASALVVARLQACSVPVGPGLDGGIQQLLRCLSDANEALRAEAARLHRRLIGTTAVALLIPVDQDDAAAAIVWAGDSRIYRLRERQLSLLTRDHSYVEEMVARGEITAEQALGHPKGHIVTRAVGASAHLQPEVLCADLRASDRFLLCSDGLTGELEDAVIAEVLEIPDRQRAVDTLVDNALYRGGHDNITALVVDVGSPPD